MSNCTRRLLRIICFLGKTNLKNVKLFKKDGVFDIFAKFSCLLQDELEKCEIVPESTMVTQTYIDFQGFVFGDVFREFEEDKLERIADPLWGDF